MSFFQTALFSLHLLVNFLLYLSACHVGGYVVSNDKKRVRLR